MSYRTGQMWSSKFSAAIGCAWIMVYPYLTGELNYILTGLGHGMKRRKLFPEGRQLVSIPFDLLPSLLQNLREMPWELPAFRPDGKEFVEQLVNQLGLAGFQGDKTAALSGVVGDCDRGLCSGLYSSLVERSG